MAYCYFSFQMMLQSKDSKHSVQAKICHTNYEQVCHLKLESKFSKKLMGFWLGDHLRFEPSKLDGVGQPAPSSRKNMGKTLYYWISKQSLPFWEAGYTLRLQQLQLEVSGKDLDPKTMKH